MVANNRRTSYVNRRFGRVSIVATDESTVKNIKIYERSSDYPHKTNWGRVIARTAFYLACLAFCTATWWVVYRVVFAIFAM